MGKAEGRDEQWHGHVTAVSVAPEFRRCGLAAVFMDGLERISEAKRCYFVDLFVRVSNETACRMYRQLGYIVYRRIIDYYSSGSGGADGPKGGEGASRGKDEEDAFGKQRYLTPITALIPLPIADMRKALSRDVEKKSVVPLKQPVSASEIEFD
jgi:N-terminal acetyltransferase B complex catalytic subunit